MTGTTATKTISLNVTGKSELRLVVGLATGGVDFDHADWADARLTCGGGTNQAPVPTIASPTAATTFTVGDTIQLQGSAVDPEEGGLSGSALSWQVNLHHCIGTTCHMHPFTSATGATGNFTVLDHGDMYYFEITLTATDSQGKSGSASVQIQPQTVQLTLATNPTGLQVVTGGVAGPRRSRRRRSPRPRSRSAHRLLRDSGRSRAGPTAGPSSTT